MAVWDIYMKITEHAGIVWISWHSLYKSKNLQHLPWNVTAVLFIFQIPEISFELLVAKNLNREDDFVLNSDRSMPLLNAS